MIFSILLFLAVLSILVLVHEIGHFVTALWMGAKVEEFGIGFPPRAVSKVRNGIRYSLNWIPLGGFVKIKGESGEDRNHPDSFASKPAWKRFIVLSAGVFMNFVLAAVLLSVGFVIGVPSVVNGTTPPAAVVEDTSVRVVTVAVESPAEAAGLMIGDTLESINGIAFETAEEAHDYIGQNIDGAFELLVTRGEEQFSYTMMAEELDVTAGRKVLGVGLLKTGTVSYPIHLAPLKGIEATALFTKEVVVAFADLLKNLVVRQSVSVDLSGPVGIAVITGQVAQLGVAHLIQFTALLSINLAVINFIPFPALDGGRVLFLFIEKVRGKPVDQRIEAFVHNIGFLILMTLIVLVTYRDIVRFGDQLLGAFQ